jgi:hypothetical protein
MRRTEYVLRLESLDEPSSYGTACRTALTLVASEMS